ncbi:uncharacterized protein LTR77_006111 [Saxophila tyrrhenica]|uniref:F-box domain-containing protein n=1 Tax=Saxophila tyrrhenica TaxID=1690608 RepID=A0AAV9P9Z8_9PEZI|nr:hypothetical protein LTR77_006111 [Saxophila tyrrhenica]
MVRDRIGISTGDQLTPDRTATVAAPRAQPNDRVLRQRITATQPVPAPQPTPTLRRTARVTKKAVNYGPPDSPPSSPLLSPLTTTKTSSHSDSETPFRFLDLPPELRNRVYGYATAGQDGSTRRLASRTLKPPAITRVSQLVRQESMPVYFDVNSSVIEVTTPHGGLRSGSFPGFLRQTDRRFMNTGRLEMPKVVYSFLRDAGKVAARIKDLHIHFDPVSSLKEFDIQTHHHPSLRWGRMGARLQVQVGGQAALFDETQLWSHDAPELRHA